MITDFILVGFITSSYLSNPKSRTFVKILFSKIKMEGFMLWRLLKRWFISNEKLQKFPSNNLKVIFKNVL